jgi:hypothetical protein
MIQAKLNYASTKQILPLYSITKWLADFHLDEQNNLGSGFSNTYFSAFMTLYF